MYIAGFFLVIIIESIWGARAVPVFSDIDNKLPYTL